MLMCWELLQIEPTKDKKVIKKAYARRLKQLDLEKQADQFQKLKAAFDRALVLAEQMDESSDKFLNENEMQHVDSENLLESDFNQILAEDSLEKDSPDSNIRPEKGQRPEISILSHPWAYFEEFLQQEEFYFSLSAWQRFFEESDVVEIERFELQRQQVLYLLVELEGYQFIDPVILDYIRSYFVWDTAEDFSDEAAGRRFFTKMTNMPRFSFEICEKIDPSQRRTYLQARYRLFQILNQKMFDSKQWQQCLAICEKNVPVDPDVFWLKICHTLQQDFRSDGNEKTWHRHLRMFKGFENRKDILFVQQYGELLMTSPEQVDLELTFVRPSTMPPKIFHLLMGYLCYRQQSYQLAYSHWQKLRGRNNGFLTAVEETQLSSYDFRKAPIYMTFSKEGAANDQPSVLYPIYRQEKRMKLETTSVEKTVEQKETPKRHKNTLQAVFVLLLLVIGIIKIINYQAKHPSDQQIKTAQWKQIKQSDNLAEQYFYYICNDDLTTDEREQFIEQYAPTLSEKTKDQLSFYRHLLEKPSAASCQILQKEKEDGTMAYLLKENYQGPFAYLEEKDGQFTVIVPRLLEDTEEDWLAYKNEMENNPYTLGKYIATRYLLEPEAQRLPEDGLDAAKDAQISEEMKSRLAEHANWIKKEELDFSSCEAYVVKTDEGYFTIIVNDARKEVFAVFAFSEDYKLLHIYADEMEEISPEAEAVLQRNFRQENVNADFIIKI